MICKNLRKSLLRKSDGVVVQQTAGCRFKMSGESMAKEMHATHRGMGMDQGKIPGVHCPLFPSADYALCPWYTEDRRENGF